MAPVVDCSVSGGGTTDDNSNPASAASLMMGIKVPLLSPLDPEEGESSQDSVAANCNKDEMAEMLRLSYRSTGLSSSFPSGGGLSRALKNIQPGEQMSSSCFANLRLVKLEGSDGGSTSSPSSPRFVDDDDDLTSLDWLQDINLLRNISPEKSAVKSKSTVVAVAADDAVDSSGGDSSSQKENVLLYDPNRNPAVKPPYSFSVLIFMAIEASPRRRLPVKDIYNWIAEYFPFYRRAPAGWRNSVRHNLSLNKCFRKVEKTLGKGSSWCIDPLFRPNLLQAMRRTPYFPFQQLQMTTSTGSSASSQCSSVEEPAAFCQCEDASGFNMPSPNLFPFLSRRLAQVRQTNSPDDIDVANTLASLRHTPQAMLSDRERKIQKVRTEQNLSEVVWTPHPYDDHIYGYDRLLVHEAQMRVSDGTVRDKYEGLGSPVDEVYDFGDVYCESESPSVSTDEDCCSSSDSEARQSVPAKEACRGRKTMMRCRRVTSSKKPDDNEEERKRLEGVDALLDLASGFSGGMTTRRRKVPLSGSMWARAVTEQLRSKKWKIQQKQKKMKKQKRKSIGRRKVK